MIEYILYVAVTVLAVLPLLLYVRNPYFFKDLRYAKSSIQVGVRINKLKKQKPFLGFLGRFLDQVARQPDKTFLIFEESSYTYSQADKESNRVARALSSCLQEGDTAAVFLGNEPMFVFLCFGLAKLGCAAALLNSNIRSRSLLHCFACSDAKVLIAGAGEMKTTMGFYIYRYTQLHCWGALQL